MQRLAKSEMQSCVRLVGVLVAVVVLASPTAGRPDGAPTGACVHMTPGHGSTTSMNTLPYTIEVNTTTYQPNGALKVTVRGEFKGILMQVRTVGTTTIVGTWVKTNLPAYTKTITCTQDDNSVTHSNTTTKMNAVFTWKAPDTEMGNLEVMATVAKSFTEWRKGIKSDTIRPDSASSTTTGASIYALLAVAWVIRKINM